MPDDPDEAYVIRTLTHRLSAPRPPAVGPGDDAAVLDDGLTLTVDAMVEGVHWDDRLSPEDVGAKLVAVNASDIAAMGATPRWFLATILLPEMSATDTLTAEIYTQIAGAWGQDPANAPVGSPGFDAGYTVIPTTTMLVNKTGALGNDLDGDGAFGPGDTITYEVAIADAGSLAFTGVELADELPDGLRYVEGSTTFDDGDGNVTPIADDVVPPAATPFPLDEAGTELPNIAAGDTVYVHFDAEIIAPTPLTEPVIGNTACVTAAEASARNRWMNSPVVIALNGSSFTATTRSRLI